MVTTILFILQTESLNLREAKWISQSYSANKWRSQVVCQRLPPVPQLSVTLSDLVALNSDSILTPPLGQCQLGPTYLLTLDSQTFLRTPPGSLNGRSNLIRHIRTLPIVFLFLIPHVRVLKPKSLVPPSHMLHI